MVGSSLSPGTKTLWIPAIMSIDLKTFEVKQEQYYDELIYEWAEFLDAFFKDGVLYCTARAKSNIYAEQIYRVNPVTLKLETFYPLPDETEKVLMADDKVYACVSKGIVILDDNFKESSFLFELDKSSFLENFSVIDDCLVVSTRKSEKIPDSDMVKIGDIYFWDINTGILKTFPLSVFPKDDIWNTIILPNREILF